ncbi:hypothetical protein ES702_00906 [subsurface metagenome]
MKKKDLKRAKKEASKNPPKELKEVMIDTSKAKEKKSSTDILKEMRYEEGV